jgi:hypothetical protein
MALSSLAAQLLAARPLCRPCKNSLRFNQGFSQCIELNRGLPLN